MTPKGELRLIVMLLCLKKAVPADKDDSTGQFLQSFAEFHNFGMVTVLSCNTTKGDDMIVKMVRRLSKIMYVSYVRGGKVRGHEQQEVCKLQNSQRIMQDGIEVPAGLLHPAWVRGS